MCNSTRLHQGQVQKESSNALCVTRMRGSSRSEETSAIFARVINKRRTGDDVLHTPDGSVVEGLKYAMCKCRVLIVLRACCNSIFVGLNFTFVV